MSLILRLISGVYLILVWTVFVATVAFLPGIAVDSAIAMQRLTGTFPSDGLFLLLLFLTAVFLSIPAIALYAFGQVVGDVRAMTDHLGAMRRYYEPNGR